MRNTEFFSGLDWRQDRMLYKDRVFRLQHHVNDKWELGGDCFMFYKTRALVDQYEKYFSGIPGFKAENVFELGIWDGGSAAFWFEFFEPGKHVGADVQNKTDSPYFVKYVEDRDIRDRLKIYWNTDQTDRNRLLDIYRREFNEPLDCVIDDASHLYGHTKESFETLFPLLRPGGIYIIEDWAWAHWKSHHDINHPFSREIPLTRLIVELAEAVGTDSGIISDLSVHQGFTVVERAPGGNIVPGEFHLDDFIARMPKFEAQAAAS
ncbi:MAG: class I SAM-dependent methyltransferase [Acidobacteria bacterium]|nr:class I SAM-dependent methyltransferase [Acidobacteriota bacterium]